MESTSGRHFALPAAVAVFLCTIIGVLPGHAPTAAAPAQTGKPTLVIIITDDQRHDTISHMPLLQRELAARGVVFTNATVTTPLCCPSRASLLRGQYAHNTGVLTNGRGEGGDRQSRWPGGAEAFPEQSSLATWLKAAGYRTGLFGKYLNGYMLSSRRVPPGWDDWHVFSGGFFNYALNENGAVRRYGREPEDYSTDVAARKTVAFIEQGGQAPLFVYYAPFAPHAPTTPHPQDTTGFSDLAPWRPPSYNEQDVSDKPEWVRRLPVLTAQRQAQGDEFRRNQLRALQAVDRAIGQIVEVLRRTGRLDNSVIVFTADNGLSWGEHRWLDRKGVAYDEAIRVPLVVRGPGIPAGRTDPRLVQNIDIAPTFAELAAARPDIPVDGRSLLALLRGGESAWRTEILLEHWGGPSLSWSAIRSDRWKYVEYESGDRELYDLTADPYEMNNGATDARHAQTVAELRRRLDALRRAGK